MEVHVLNLRSPSSPNKINLIFTAAEDLITTLSSHSPLNQVCFKSVVLPLMTGHVGRCNIDTASPDRGCKLCP